MKKIKFILLQTSLLLCLFQYSVSQNSPENKTFRIIGYYQGGYGDVNNYEYRKLTHVIFCFTDLKGNKISLKDTADERTLSRLVAQKQKHPQLKVLISLGGWSGCATCSPVFAVDSNRRIFARSVRDFIVRYGLDGIDLDWESPVIGGYKDHPAIPQDKDNFTSLVKELRHALPLPYIVCFDANSFPEYILTSVDWPHVMPNVDFVNLMTYGLPNDKPGHTGHHTALYSSPFQKESVQSGVNLLDSLKVPLDKIVIGAAFYSFVVVNADSVNFGLGRPGKVKNSPDFRTTIKKFTAENGYQTYWDTIAMAPYLYSFKERTFITLDNKESCRLKTKYAIDNKMGGIMFWRLNGDAHEDGLLNAIYETRQSNR
ncbi:MAG: glycoside hydrolase family 18 protein [Bacteroidales bacterium]